MGKSHALRAIDAFSRGLRKPPVLTNDAAAWGGLSICEWKLPWLDGFDLAENDDFIVAYHSAGSHRVRAACNGPWSEKTSIPGLISVIPPDHKVEYAIDGKVSFSSIHIPRHLLEGLSTSPFVGEPNFRFAFEDAFARSCMQILLDEARSTRSCNFPYVHAVARALVLHLMAAFQRDAIAEGSDEEDHRNTSGRRLDAMLDFIDSQLSEPLSLTDLADKVGVSRAHFARRFRTLTGTSPHRYLTMRRIEKAKQLLGETTDSLAQIALEVGFSNQSHFTQVFHATTGITPSQYRRKSESRFPRAPMDATHS
ncbi:MAG: AraC family transcriptional regulator [Rhodocyclaceae bacterium]|jgi:AraC family transcriptional regulator|nr:AraC family transcriptional regulator [Rhodocyclaceae bacterium]